MECNDCTPLARSSISRHQCDRHPERNWESCLPCVALPGGGYVAGVCIVWNSVAAHKTPDGPKPFAPLSIVAFTSTDGYTWTYSSVIANWTSLPE
eukprot:SAG11_NODE_25111_length_363_cov_1.367424_1_plen_94_part_10